MYASVVVVVVVVVGFDLISGRIDAKFLFGAADVLADVLAGALVVVLVVEVAAVIAFVVVDFGLEHCTFRV